MLLLTSCWLFADTLSSKHPELVTWFDWGFTFFTGLGWGLVFGFKEKNQKFWLSVVTFGGYFRWLLTDFDDAPWTDNSLFGPGEEVDSRLVLVFVFHLFWFLLGSGR